MKFRILGVLMLLTGCVQKEQYDKELESPVLDTLCTPAYNYTIQRDTLEIGIFLIEITRTFFDINIPNQKEENE